ncbi:MAG: 2'-deoxycytidine 5'-triphosphate deaminase [Nanoarchaeota archaeon]
MSLERVLGHCLASQGIRQWVEQGKIIVPSMQKGQIQPSSFEPVIGDEIFILDTEDAGLFRPQANESIYRTLLKLPGRKRQRIQLRKGFELKRGYTYIAPLSLKLNLTENEVVRSSPKSSIGRVFLQTRMMADYNQGFEEIQGREGKSLDSWLLIQPRAFNVVIAPGLSLNQIRFMNGLDAKLSASEIKEEIGQNPILYTKTREGEVVPAQHYITDGLRIHLGLSGIHTNGIVGLRARRNPAAIDLRLKEAYKAEEFFEPLVHKEGRIVIDSLMQYYLIASHEILKIPAHLNSELRRYSTIGLVGPLDFAGFIDNGFEGDLVFEIRSDEMSNMELTDGMPVSYLDFFRTPVPEKLYGAEIGSSYQGQTGVKPAKYFGPFDFKFAAKNYKKLDREVLVQDARVLQSHRKQSVGFEWMDGAQAETLFGDINGGFFQSRYDCEYDPALLQLLPYVVVFGPDKTVYSYVRAENIQDYGEERLFGKHSIGLGGHIAREDAPDYIMTCLNREAFREEVSMEGTYSEPKFLGTLFQSDTPVDQVHLGLIFAVHTKGRARQKESSIVSGEMRSMDELVKDPNRDRKYETWSRVLISHLPQLYERSLS